MEPVHRPSRFEVLMERLSKWFENLGAFTYDHKGLVIIGALLLLGISVFFTYKVRFDNSFESYFEKDDPAYVTYLQFRKDFGSDEIAYILYEAPEKTHGAWDLEVIKQIARLTDALENEVPFVKEVTSVYNAEFIEGKDDELLIHAILDPFPQTQDELLAIREKVMKKPLLVGTLISKDGRYGAILMEMEKSSVDAQETLIFDPARGTDMDNLYPQVTNDAIERILARPEYKSIQFHYTGDVPLGSVYNRITRSESTRLGIIAFSVIGALLLFFFRKPLAVIGPLVIMLMAILSATGFAGMMGWKLDLMFTMLPGTLVTVGVASAVHILTGYTVFQKKLKDKRSAIRKTMLLVGVPCLFTMLTDVAGFGSTNISPITAIQHFAFYSAIGVMMGFLLTVTLFLSVLPMFDFLPESAPSAEDKSAPGNGVSRKKPFSVRFFAGLSRFDSRYYWKITIAWTLFFILSASGIAFLTVDSNLLTEFSEDVPIRKTTEFVDEVMIGAGGFNYIFDSGKPDGISDPEFLKRVDRIQSRIDEEKELVMKTMSVVDLLKDINQSFHGEDPAYYVLPESRELNAQYLLLYEMSGGEKLETYITGDQRMVNLEVHAKLVPSSIYKKVTDSINEFIEKNYDESSRPILTGSGFLWVQLIEYIVQSQIFGFSLAFCIIAIMMCLVLGSIRIGLLAMVPNLAPVLVTLGFMGWAGIPLDYVKLLVASIAIGIAVDDTLHFILRFRLDFQHTRNYQQALESSLNDVGRAIFITTLALLAGFSVNLLSVMNSISEFALLTLITLSVAAIADYFLTPALIIGLKAFGPEKDEKPVNKYS